MTPLSTPAAQGTVAGPSWETLRWTIHDEVTKHGVRDGAANAAVAISALYARAMLSASPPPEALPASGVEAELRAALQLAKDMFIANNLSLPHTFEVIDAALTSAPAPEDR